MGFIFKILALFCALYLVFTVVVPIVFGFMFYFAIIVVIVYSIYALCNKYLG